MMEGAFSNSMHGASSLSGFGGNRGLLEGLMGDPLLDFSGHDIQKSQLGFTGLGLDGALSSLMGGGYASRGFQYRELLELRSRLLENELMMRAFSERALKELAFEVHSLALSASIEAHRELAQYLALAEVPSSEATAASLNATHASIPRAPAASAETDSRALAQHLHARSPSSVAAAGSQASTPDARATLVQQIASSSATTPGSLQASREGIPVARASGGAKPALMGAALAFPDVANLAPSLALLAASNAGSSNAAAINGSRLETRASPSNTNTNNAAAAVNDAHRNRERSDVIGLLRFCEKNEKK